MNAFSQDGDTVKRGCMQDLFPDAFLCSNKSDTCKMCIGNNCNKRNQFQECYSCSSETDSQCSRNPQLTSSEICNDYDSICMIGIDENGHIHRQCKSRKSDTTASDFKNDFICDDIKCNVDLFPKDRLKCYQCVGDECSDLSNSSNGTEVSVKSEPCAILLQREQCYTYIDKGKIINKILSHICAINNFTDKVIVRGCLSDSTNESLMCKQSSACVKCTTSGCNNYSRYKKPEFSCVKCSDLEECAFGQNTSLVIPCANEVSLGDEESCYIRSIGNSFYYRIHLIQIIIVSFKISFILGLKGTKQVERGCTLDIDFDVNREKKGFKKCSVPGCNVENVRFNWCLRCHGEISGNCSSTKNPYEYFHYCDHSSYPYKKRGCFTKQSGIKRHYTQTKNQLSFYVSIQMEEFFEGVLLILAMSIFKNVMKKKRVQCVSMIIVTRRKFAHQA